LHNPVFRVSRIFCNPAFCVSRILCNPAFRVSRIFRNLAFRVSRINPAFRVSNPTRTSCFLLHVANPANPIYSSIRAAVLANPANLICLPIRAVLLANPICLSICVTVLINPAQVALLRLANPVNLAGVIRIFSPVRDLCSSTCQPRVTWPDHLTTLGQHHTCSLRVLLVFRFRSRHFALVFANRLTNASSIDMNLGRHFAWPRTHHHDVLLGLSWPS
jgi:hypothetical protein